MKPAGDKPGIGPGWQSGLSIESIVFTHTRWFSTGRVFPAFIIHLF